jgi:RIMS-binding protein 2
MFLFFYRTITEITKDTASERSGDSYRGRDGQGMNPYDRNKSLPANRNPQMVGGPRNAQGQGRDNYYSAQAGRNQQQQQQNDGYYDQPANRRPVARGGNGRQPPMQQQQQQQTRIFVALFDYDPPTMSPNPDACDEELPFREGQLIKVHQKNFFF